MPCELIVINGAGHGFAGEQGKQASEALMKWFDKYLAKPTNGDHKPGQEKAATAN